MNNTNQNLYLNEPLVNIGCKWGIFGKTTTESRQGLASLHATFRLPVSPPASTGENLCSAVAGS